MKVIYNLLGITCAFALMILLLITSIEAVTYWTPGYYEKEYTKHHVLDTVPMEMEDLLDVTEEMMAYLRGNRDDLHVFTKVNFSMNGKSPTWRMCAVCSWRQLQFVEFVWLELWESWCFFMLGKERQKESCHVPSVWEQDCSLLCWQGWRH